MTSHPSSVMPVPRYGEDVVQVRDDELLKAYDTPFLNRTKRIDPAGHRYHLVLNVRCH